MSHTFTTNEIYTSANNDEWSIRLYREGDIPALVALINAADAVDQFNKATTEQEMIERFAMPLSDPPRQVVIVEGPAVEGVPASVPLGYGRIICFDDESGDERLYQFALLVHPAPRGRDLERAITGRLIALANDNERNPNMAPRTTVSLLANIRSESKALTSLFDDIGLQDVRHAWVMERNLEEPLDAPRTIEGVTIRNYRRPEDNVAALASYNDSFRDHFEFHALTQEIWDYQVGLPAMRPNLSWLAEIQDEPGKIAGFCLSQIHDEKNGRSGKSEGWIELLGIIRGWRGKGLGKSILLHGMHSLKNAGIKTALLGVDSESPTGANRLYESVGFRVRHHEILYKAPLNEVQA